MELKYEGFLSQPSSGDQDVIMDLSWNSQAHSEKKALVLSGSEFDELDEQIEGIIMEEEEVWENRQLTPTEAVLLSQRGEMLKLVNERLRQQEDELSLPSQSIDEILGTQQEAPTKVTPVPMANNEAISNSSSPIENEKLQQMKEEQENANKIEIQVELTEEQQRQQESLQFGTCKGPTKGIGYGQNSFKN